MPTSVIPAFIDALVAACTTELPDVVVTDGYAVTQDPTDYLMVGVDASQPDAIASSADSVQSYGPMASSRPRDENGSVTCSAGSFNGDGDAKKARDAAFAIVAAVENVCRADPSFGIAAGGLFTTLFGGNVQLLQDQDSTGATAMVVFTVGFQARI